MKPALVVGFLSNGEAVLTCDTAAQRTQSRVHARRAPRSEILPPLLPSRLQSPPAPRFTMAPPRDLGGVLAFGLGP